MPVWEYQIDVGTSIFGGKPEAYQLQRHLSKRGEESWELVTFASVDSREGKQDWLIFRRPVPPKRVTG